MSNKKELQKAEQETQNTALALAGIDFGSDVGAGMEGADRESYAIPFLRVIQKSSPQVDETNAAFREEARAGQFVNSVNGKLYDGKQGLIFVPCAFQRRFLRWGPRGEGGYRGEVMPEVVAQMLADGTAVTIDGRIYVREGNGEVNEKKADRLVDTRSHFGLVLDDSGAFSQVLLTLSSTQIKKSKQLMSILSEVKVRTAAGQLVTPPTWANKIRITTTPESNDQGNWYGVRFEAAGFIDSTEVYNAGRAFHAAIAEGSVKANFAESRDEEPHVDDRKF